MKRILADGIEVDRFDKLNDNDLIIGSSGSGKTFSYVRPNLMSPNSSVIISDPKGQLYRDFKHFHESINFKVMHIDLTGGGKSSIGFNPLDYITDAERDIMRISTALIPEAVDHDPYWTLSARNLLTALIAFIVEKYPDKDKRTLRDVLTLSEGIPDGRTQDLMQKHKKNHPDSYACRKWSSFWITSGSPKTAASIASIMANMIEAVNMKDSLELFTMKERLDFKALAKGKIALYLSVSDTDRTADPLISLFYTIAMQELTRYADSLQMGHLPYPVRLYLDDFATNCVIPDFDRIISTIRSRGISVAVVLQTLSQLEAAYGPAKAKTIANGCDHVLYYGGTDIDTATYISKLTNQPMHDILHMPLGNVWVIANGMEAKCTKRYAWNNHPKRDEFLAESVGRQQQRIKEKSVAELLESATPLLITE